MNRKIKLIFLALILTLNFSCLENQSSAKETNKAEWAEPSQTDTLKFTSGIRAIFQDSKGNYWFGSNEEGVAVYNGKSFTYFTTTEGLTDNQIHSIQEDKAGNVWFNTQTGVCSYDGTKINDHTKVKDKSQSFFPIQGHDSKAGEWMKLDNDLWFEAGNRSGVYRYDGQGLHYLEFPPQKVLNPNNNLFAVTGIAKGSHDMIWFGTYAGVFGYNGKEFTIINDETLGYDRKIEPLHIRSVFEDSKGRLWIGNNGIGVLLKEGDSIINFSNKHRLIHPNSRRNGEKSPQGTLEHVFVITEDSNGNIWLGDRDAGVWKYDGKQLENYTTKDGLENDFVLSIFEDRNKELWFGAADGSLYKFKSKRFEKQF